MDKSLITEYLKQSIARKYVIKCFIFGSIAKGVTNPNDCDLFIVTNQEPRDKDWIKFLSDLDQLEKSFELKFSLRLNLTINTEKEFYEYSLFKDRILKQSILIII